MEPQRQSERRDASGGSLNRQDSARERAQGIRLDYFKHPSKLEQTKWLLAIVGVLVVFAWLGFTMLLPAEASQEQFSPGPINRVHVAKVQAAAAQQNKDSTCEVCHTPGQPLRGDSWFLWGRGELRGSDHNCTASGCHPNKQDPPHTHSAFQIPSEISNCAGCHPDHQGVDFKMALVDDRRCIECHRDLTVHSTKNFGQPAPDYDTTHVTAFDTKHPKFSSLLGEKLKGKDESKLKFSHARHLTPGLTQQPGHRGAWRLKDIAPEYRGRYAQFVDADDKQDYLADAAKRKEIDELAVHLDCKACHEPYGSRDNQDANWRPSPNEPPRATGEYMRPIRFDQHCKPCHELNVLDASATLTHGLKREKLVEALQGMFSVQKLKAEDKKPRERARPLPQDPPPPAIPPDFVNLKLNEASKYLGSTALCGKCHDFEGGLLPTEAEVVPTKVPNHWLKFALFDHTAHQKWKCDRCHDKARGSVANTDILIANRDSCLECHSENPKKQDERARSNCGECHKYHGYGEHDERRHSPSVRPGSAPADPTAGYLRMNDFFARTKGK